MILFALIVIWLLLIAFIVALCQIAAAADNRYEDAAGRYPTLAAQGPRAKLPGPRRWDGPYAPAARDLRPGAAAAGAMGGSGAGTGMAAGAGMGSIGTGAATRVRGGRGRGGRYAAGS